MTIVVRHHRKRHAREFPTGAGLGALHRARSDWMVACRCCGRSSQLATPTPLLAVASLRWRLHRSITFSEPSFSVPNRTIAEGLPTAPKYASSMTCPRKFDPRTFLALHVSAHPRKPASRQARVYARVAPRTTSATYVRLPITPSLNQSPNGVSRQIPWQLQYQIVNQIFCIADPL